MTRCDFCNVKVSRVRSVDVLYERKNPVRGRFRPIVGLLMSFVPMQKTFCSWACVSDFALYTLRGTLPRPTAPSGIS